MPPLIKAYLRVGAYVGSGAVIDSNFDTTDVLIILDTKKLLKKYSNLSKGLTTWRYIRQYFHFLELF